MMLRTMLLGAATTALLGCAARPAAFNPDDPAALAEVDSVVSAAIAGAETVDADRVLAMAEGPAEFTFVTGDALLEGLPAIKEDFKETYDGLRQQRHEILGRKVRLIAPDVALYSAVGDGTYTDLADWTSPPVGLGVTIVLVKRDAKWQAVHAHQSVAF
jgi:uncharacterized protein (TIGR02246 family)